MALRKTLMATHTTLAMRSFATALAFGLAALSTIAYAPRAGSPVLVYPLTKHGRDNLMRLDSHPETQILARSEWNGELIVRLPVDAESMLLLTEHIIVLNADAPGCRPARAPA